MKCAGCSQEYESAEYTGNIRIIEGDGRVDFDADFCRGCLMRLREGLMQQYHGMRDIVEKLI